MHTPPNPGAERVDPVATPPGPTTVPPAAAGLPTARAGVTGEVLTEVVLPPAFDCSGGRRLRMRRVTIAPGGALPMHSHVDRPAVAHVLQGTLTEHVEGEPGPVHFGPGQSYAVHERPHALLNHGDLPVVFLEIDLF